MRKKAHNLARVRDKKIRLFEDPEQIPNNRLYCIKNLIYRLDKHTTNSIFKVVTHFCWELRISGKISIDFHRFPALPVPPKTLKCSDWIIIATKKYRLHDKHS